MTDMEKLAQWMLRNSFATGHGDTIDDLLAELEWQIEELREALKLVRDRLEAFVGAVADITDCSADVDALNAADAALGLVPVSEALRIDEEAAP